MKVEIKRQKGREPREFFLRITSDNGRILMVSGDGYKRRAGARNCFNRLVKDIKLGKFNWV